MSAISLQDLNPIEATIILNHKEYTLRKFDLLARTWAYTEFASKENEDGLSALAEKMKHIERDFSPLLKTCWHLLKRKRDFGSYEKFLEAVENDDEKDFILKIGELLQAFNKTLGVSELTMEDVKEDLELKKS